MSAILKTGDLFPMEIVEQGAVRVNEARVFTAHEDCILINVDLHSKRAELSWIFSIDNFPAVGFRANDETTGLHNDKPDSSETVVKFHEHEDWRIWAYSVIQRYSLNLTLVKLKP